MVRLSDLYSADFRANHPEAMKLAGEVAIPHPLNNVQYADGISLCRHAKKHRQGDFCPQEFRKTEPAPRHAARPSRPVGSHREEES